MSKGNVVEFKKPAGVDDPVTEVLRQGARKLLAQAIEAEVEAFLAEHAELALANGHRRVVRNGYLPEREVQTGIGSVAISIPRVRDKGGAGEGGKVRFTSKILQPYLGRTKSIEELIP
jgi:putative transposase